MSNDSPTSVPAPERLETDRLILRRWREADIEPFAALNSDPVVMEHFPTMLTRFQTEQLVVRLIDCFEQNNFGLWATEVKENGAFIGFVGLIKPTFEAHFTPCVEVGWRLAREFWGNGYAPEGAREV